MRKRESLYEEGGIEAAALVLGAVKYSKEWETCSIPVLFCSFFIHKIFYLIIIPALSQIFYVKCSHKSKIKNQVTIEEV